MRALEAELYFYGTGVRLRAGRADRSRADRATSDRGCRSRATMETDSADGPSVIDRPSERSANEAAPALVEHGSAPPSWSGRASARPSTSRRGPDDRPRGPGAARPGGRRATLLGVAVPAEVAGRPPRRPSRAGAARGGASVLIWAIAMIIDPGGRRHRRVLRCSAADGPVARPSSSAGRPTGPVGLAAGAARAARMRPWPASWSPRPIAEAASTASGTPATTSTCSSSSSPDELLDAGQGRPRPDHPLGHHGHRRGARGRAPTWSSSAGPASGSTTSTWPRPPPGASWWSTRRSRTCSRRPSTPWRCCWPRPATSPRPTPR